MTCVTVSVKLTTFQNK